MIVSTAPIALAIVVLPVGFILQTRTVVTKLTVLTVSTHVTELQIVASGAARGMLRTCTVAATGAIDAIDTEATLTTPDTALAMSTEAILVPTGTVGAMRTTAHTETTNTVIASMAIDTADAMLAISATDAIYIAVLIANILPKNIILIPVISATMYGQPFLTDTKHTTGRKTIFLLIGIILIHPVTSLGCKTRINRYNPHYSSPLLQTRQAF